MTFNVKRWTAVYRAYLSDATSVSDDDIAALDAVDPSFAARVRKDRAGEPSDHEPHARTHVTGKIFSTGKRRRSTQSRR